ncbi:pilus assembly protein [bacterium]|nr:pilus assembly protein [bacterium]
MPAIRLNLIKRFSTVEDGAITVESILWVPVYAFFFAFIVDVSLLFHSQTQVQRVLQDVNRLASTGFLVTEAEVEDRVRASLNHMTTSATVESTIDSATNLITTTATVPAGDLMAVGIVSKFTNLDLNFTAQHVVES